MTSNYANIEYFGGKEILTQESYSHRVGKKGIWHWALKVINDLPVQNYA